MSGSSIGDWLRYFHGPGSIAQFDCQFAFLTVFVKISSEDLKHSPLVLCVRDK